jgi:hypothetical protein
MAGRAAKFLLPVYPAISDNEISPEKGQVADAVSKLSALQYDAGRRGNDGRLTLNCFSEKPTSSAV